MSEYNERKLLRRLQALSRIEPDLESTERAMANARKAIMELEEEAARPKRLFGIGSVRRLLAYAVAAVILIAIGFGVALVWKGADGKNTREIVQQPKAMKDDTAIAAPALQKGTKDDAVGIEADEPRLDIEQELRMVLSLAGAGDVDGLIRVLREGEFAGKLAAAGYLMQIGDAGAIEPLEQLSTEWYGLDEANPFAIAVKAIKSRIAQGTVDEPKEITPSDDGTLRIDSLEPGVYTLRLAGPNMEETTLENVRAPSDDVEVEIQYAPKPKISGTVLDAATGQPVEKFRVRLRKVKSLRGPSSAQSGDWSAFDSEKGVFEVEVVGPGIYQVQVHAAGYSPAWSEEINTDENAGVRIELAVGGTIKGEVVDAAGKGISGAMVIPLSLAAGTMIEHDGTKIFASREGAVETVDGLFELKHIGQGQESIKVVHPDYSVAFQRDIEVRNGYLTGGIVVTLHKGSVVQGYVYDRHGRPQPDVTLGVQDADVYSPGSEYEKAGRLATTTTDSEGFYRAEALPSGRMCYIKRGDMDKRNGVVCRAIVPTDNKITQLDFGAGPVVSGQVMVDGRFLANSTILLADPEGSSLDVFKSYTMTDAQGGFAFIGAPVGRHGVYMEQGRQRGAWFRIATIEVDVGDVDSGIIELATSTIEVQVKADDPNQVPEDVTVYLQQGHGFTGARVGNVRKPSRRGAPYIIEDVLPGEYTVVAGRSDLVQGRKELTVGASPETIATTVTIPQGGAGVSGHYIGPSSGMVFLLSNDGAVACCIDPDDADIYRINDLPAGDYLIVNNMSGRTLPLLAFNIAAGEHRVVDLDMSDWLAADRAALHTLVVSDAGVPVSGAQVWLEGEGVAVVPVRNNSEGQFFVAEPGEYLIHAEYPALGRAERRVVMPANDITRPRRAETTIILRLTQQ
ncbi:MAG: hypothetical protein DRP66_09095 [Planctomycetota bacterium]|nr:MAG: hypothetical protein DRP66_09095 [Planctomycetota bacterium]